VESIPAPTLISPPLAAALALPSPPLPDARVNAPVLAETILSILTAPPTPPAAPAPPAPPLPDVTVDAAPPVNVIA